MDALIRPSREPNRIRRRRTQRPPVPRRSTRSGHWQHRQEARVSKPRLELIIVAEEVEISASSLAKLGSSWAPVLPLKRGRTVIRHEASSRNESPVALPTAPRARTVARVTDGQTLSPIALPSDERRSTVQVVVSLLMAALMAWSMFPG